MKLALVNDIHFGARSDSEAIARFQQKFYGDVFFPHLKKNGIEDIVMLGDVFERRKYINFKSLKFAYDMFFNPAEEAGINVHILSGNHDVYYRNTNSLNSIDLLVSRYTNIKTLVTEHPKEVKFGDDSILFVPWITTDNQKECLESIGKSFCPVVFGHFDINGFEMAPGALCEHGLESDLFYRFEHVLSGHYHIKSSAKNITYLGTQYQMDWGDFGQTKGFHVYDTKAKMIEFVTNPHTIFSKVVYNENKKNVVPDVKGKFVKVVVENREDLYKFEKWLAQLTSQSPEDIQVIEPIMVFDDSGVDDDSIPKTTVDILNEYVGKIENISEMTASRTKSLLNVLYQEAQSQ